MQTLASPSDSNGAAPVGRVFQPVHRHGSRACIAILAASILLSAGHTPAADKTDIAPLVGLLGQLDDTAIQLDVLRGMHQSLRGRSDVKMPESWPAVYKKLAASDNAEVRDTALAIALILGDRDAMAALEKLMFDAQAPVAERNKAVLALVQRKDPRLVPQLQKLVADAEVRGAALRGLASFGDPQTPAVILAGYGKFSASEKQDAINTLASRPAYATALLDALEKKQIARADVSAFTARQLLGLKNKDITQRLEKVWGSIRETKRDKAKLIKRYQTLLTDDYLKQAKADQGRVVYAKTCRQCHRLFDDGGQIGPELTGSQRHNLDYVLLNLIDPSASVARDYQMTIFQTADGRVINGIIKEESEKTLVIQTPNEQVLLAKDQIETQDKSPLSMMPEGMVQKLSDQEMRDLVAYLASRSQVPPPPGVDLDKIVPAKQ